MSLLVFKLILLPLILGWQVQGGHRQAVQLTQRARFTQPATIQVQGNDFEYESQPALGYNVLDSSGQALTTVFLPEF